MFLHYIEKRCNWGTYFYKGDDDILVNPVIFTSIISEQFQNPKVHSFGCMVEGAIPIRDPKSKYFVPLELWREEKYSNYYSGASFIFNHTIMTPFLRMYS